MSTANRNNYKKKWQNSISHLPKKYKDNNKEFYLDVNMLKEQYLDFFYMTDEEFQENIYDALHFACYVCFLKNIPTKDILSDEGLIHSLVHLLSKSTRKFVEIKQIRKKFNEMLIIT